MEAQTYQPIPTEKKVWLSRNEVAALLDVSPVQVSKAYCAGLLKGVKIGGIFRFHRDDIDAMRTTKPPRRGR